MNNPVTIEKPLYTAIAVSTGGREGRVKTDDGILDLSVTMPKSLGGPGHGSATNPEQLFAAGYAACFGSAFAAAARMKKVTTGPVEITAKVAIGKVGAGFGLAVELLAKVPELPREDAEALLHAAHQICPYSNATRGNIVVDVQLA